MTAQLDLIDLFDYIAKAQQNYRHSDPVTSKAAGRSANEFRSLHHSAILNALRTQGRPLSAEEISDHTALDYVQVGKRLIELVRAGLVERTAELHTNRSGRRALRHRLKPQSDRAARSTLMPPI